jgi:hypothetical protein
VPQIPDSVQRTGEFHSRDQQLGKHAFIDLPELLLNHVPTKISAKHVQWSPIVKAFLFRAKAVARLRQIPED